MQEETDLITIPISGEITTCSNGINRLMQFYSDASKFHNESIYVDFSNLIAIDANLTAFLEAICYRLKRENKIELCTDYDFLAKNFNILFQNGWLKDDSLQIGENGTTLPCMQFSADEKENFCHYIDNKLILHKGMKSLPSTLARRMKADLIEIFTNIYRHAQTNYPFFVCGQFYPELEYLVFTMVDLGVGFLRPINRYTNNEIQTDLDAIKWALAGNSTKIIEKDDVGGIGLQSIFDYCDRTNGVFQIYSGTDFWDSGSERFTARSMALSHRFNGSLLNLFFRTNN